MSPARLAEISSNPRALHLTLIGQDEAEWKFGEWMGMGSVSLRGRESCNEKWGYTLRPAREFIYNPTAQ